MTPPHESQWRSVKQWAREALNTHLDSEQLAAVSAPGRNVRVVARAGTGKTRVLVTRALYLQQFQGVSPQEILLLAFNRKAASEMKHRLKKHVGANMPHVMTFHALAHALVHPAETILYDDHASDQQSLSAEVASIENQPTKSMHIEIKRIARSPSIFRRIFEFIIAPFVTNWNDIESAKIDLDKEDEDSIGRHHEATTLNGDKQALNGDWVKSFGERSISNVLFTHDIKATYEEPFRWNGTSYRPDFTIRPDDDIRADTGVVIEYFGIKQNERYEKQKNEKRRFWKNKPGWSLIEFTPSDLKQSREQFAHLLLSKLKSHGIEGRPLRPEEILGRLPQRRSVDLYIQRLTKFITRCRHNDLSHADLQTRMQGHRATDDEERSFLSAAEAVYAAYLDEVIGNGYEDFNGLLWRAVEKVRSGESEFVRDGGKETGDLQRVRFVLIDEFQDFMEPFDALIEAITTGNPETRLFCVGDDWQAINAFAGSALRYFNRFDELFDEALTCRLTTNYRSSTSVVGVSNALMADVDADAPVAVASTDRPGSAHLWRLDEFQATDMEGRQHGNHPLTSAVLRLVKAQLESGRATVLLSRTKHLPKRWGGQALTAFLQRIHYFMPQAQRQRVTASTTHGYKGLENDAVIILDALDWRYPLVHPNWKFERIFGDTEDEIRAEERRLFYVGLTRAKDSLDVITDTRDESPFLSSISSHVDRRPSSYRDLLLRYGLRSTEPTPQFARGSWESVQPPSCEGY